MLSLFQIADLNDYLTSLSGDIAETIRTKPVQRYSKGLGSFEAPVNATGNLANSVEHTITENSVSILANDYINKLINGQAPGEFPTQFDIENWLSIKGLTYNPYSVINNIGFFGSTIYQQFKGQESNLLEDYIQNNQIDPEITEEVMNIVNRNLIDTITREMLEQFKAA
jgi:hypothetical protein